jgi:beta-glucosidase-like glycosyl hydrolase
MEKLIAEHHIGGLTFFHSRHSAAANFEKRQEKLSYENTLEKLIEQINRYQLVTKIPLIISIDAEFGLAMRIENTPQYPYAISLGAMDISEKDLVYEVGKRIAKDLKAAGIHLNFAPVADINSNPNNPVIGYRSFGRDKEKVNAFAWQMYKAHIDQEVGACYKHFPGHGDTDVDSHLGIPILQKTKKDLEKEELFPFAKAIAKGLDMIMVGHLAVPALTDGKEIPASICKEIITGLLKEEMKFEGLVVSDALNMKSVADNFPHPGQLEYEAFMAGNDILCFSEHVKEGIEWIEKNAPEEMIHESFSKIMNWKEKYKVLEIKKIKVPYFDWGAHTELQERLASKYLTEISPLKEQMILEKCVKVSFNAPETNHFFKGLNEVILGPEHNLQNLGEAFEELEEHDWVLASVFVPSAKPVHHFGLNLDHVEKLVRLSSVKKVYLYLFGNPLAMQEFSDLKHFMGIIGAYQQFEETQKVAALHFRGELKTQGRWD